MKTMSCLQAIETLPRAIIACRNGCWGITEKEGSHFGFARHSSLRDAVVKFSKLPAELIVLSADEERMLDLIANATQTGRTFVAEWAPALVKFGEDGWLRPFPLTTRKRP